MQLVPHPSQQPFLGGLAGAVAGIEPGVVSGQFPGGIVNNSPLFRRIGVRLLHVETADSLGDAVRRARAYAEEDDLILAFGSLSYLGELSRQVRMTE